MKVKHEYIDFSSRDLIIGENSNLYLIEEQNITEGNFLIFSDTLIPEERPETEVERLAREKQELENQLLLLENEKVGGIL